MYNVWRFSAACRARGREGEKVRRKLSRESEEEVCGDEYALCTIVYVSRLSIHLIRYRGGLTIAIKTTN